MNPEDRSSYDKVHIALNARKTVFRVSQKHKPNDVTYFMTTTAHLNFWSSNPAYSRQLFL